MSMMRTIGSWQPLVISLLVVLLTGCSGGGHQDLQDYVNKIKASKVGRIEPLPEFVPVESFAYSASKLPDPFMSWQTKAAMEAKVEKSKNSSGLQPDLGRRREPLEAFPLDTLRMVGTMEKGGKTSALIRSPDGLVSRVVVGNYLGQNYGRIVAIKPGKVDLVEIVPDGLGSWVKRQASLAIAE